MGQARWLAGAFAAMLVLALSACGNNSRSATPTKQPSRGQVEVEATAAMADPCALVTAAEVAKALGGKVGPGVIEPGGLPGQRTCTFATLEGARLATVGTVPGGADLFGQLRGGLGAKAQDIAGLGDRAAREAAYLIVLRGDKILIVFLGGMGDGDKALAPLTTLAKAALGRMT